MLTLAAFASLAQLGSGLALALAIFVEPITFRELRYRRKLEGALKLLPRNGSEQTQDRETEVLVKMVDLNSAAKRAHELARHPLLLIKIAALINFLILLLATIAPEGELSASWMWALLALCILPVAIGVAWLSAIARVKIGRLED